MPYDLFKVILISATLSFVSSQPCPADAPFKSSKGCVSNCSGIGSGLQAPAGTCWDGALCPPGYPFLNSENKICSASCGSSYRLLKAGRSSKDSQCTSDCADLRTSIDPLGRKTCQLGYCPSSAPFLTDTNTCGVSCPSGKVLNDNYECVAACPDGQSVVNNITGNPNVCKSTACSAYNQQTCVKTKRLDSLLPFRFAERVPPTAKISSLDYNPNRIYDSITALLFDAKTSSPTCTSALLDGTLGCFETLIKTCFLNSASISTPACAAFQLKLTTFPILKEVIARLTTKNTPLSALTVNNQPIEAGELAILEIYNILGKPSSSVLGSFEEFSSTTEFYMVITVLTSFIQNYNPDVVNPTLLRSYVEFFYLSFLSSRDISNLFMMDEYTAVSAYLQSLGTKTVTLVKRSDYDDEISINETISDNSDLGKRAVLSVAYLSDMINAARMQCSINNLPDSAVGCLSLGMYLETLDAVSSVIIYDTIFAYSNMEDIYANCAGWVKAWTGLESNAPYNSAGCQTAVEAFCTKFGASSAGCSMAYAVVRPIFAEKAQKRCPPEIGASCRVSNGNLA